MFFKKKKEKKKKRVGGVFWGGGGGGGVSNWGYSCLGMLVSLFGFPWCRSEMVAR